MGVLKDEDDLMFCIYQNANGQEGQEGGEGEQLRIKN